MMDSKKEKSDLPPDANNSSFVNNGGSWTSYSAVAPAPMTAPAPATSNSAGGPMPANFAPQIPPASGYGYQPYPVQMPQQQQQQQGITVILARPAPQKSLSDAYLLWFPLGLIGLHHFYLRRYAFGFLYLFTGGGCVIGWLIDAFRMPSLVREANARARTAGLNGANGNIGDDEEERISVTDAYIMWFPLGLIGLHHYYLRRPCWGVAYTFTGGLFAIGWIVDAFRLPKLVAEANERLALERAHRLVPVRKSLCDAYALGATPAGIFGAHHFYLGRVLFGVYYMLTGGGFGIGWIVDWFRMPVLVERANNPNRNPLGIRHKYVDDAYVLAFPAGVLGLHHYYLERPGWGTLYLLTGGLCGIGWLIDLCRMPCLVAETNRRLEQEASLIDAVKQVPFTNGGGPAGTTTCIVTSGDMSAIVACQTVNPQTVCPVTVHQSADGGPTMFVSPPPYQYNGSSGLSAPPEPSGPVRSDPTTNYQPAPPAYVRYGSMEEAQKLPKVC